MIAALIQISVMLGPILAEANPQDEDGGGWLLLAGPAAGVALYSMLFRYYRNTDKSHAYEQETEIVAQPVTGGERKIDEVKGTRRSEISGDNVGAYRIRVKRVQ